MNDTTHKGRDEREVCDNSGVREVLLICCARDKLCCTEYLKECDDRSERLGCVELKVRKRKLMTSVTTHDANNHHHKAFKSLSIE